MVLQLCDATGYPLSDSHGNPITTTSDANGYYEFTGLRPGVYSIVEAQPSQYVPGIDTAGSKGGLVVDRYATPDAEHPQHLGGRSLGRRDRADSDQAGRRGRGVQLQRGADRDGSRRTVRRAAPRPFATDPLLACRRRRMPVRAVPAVGDAVYTLPLTMMQPIFGGGGGPGGYTWHLSVIDAGQPRSDASGADSPKPRRVCISIRSPGPAPTWASRSGFWPTRTACRSRNSASAWPAQRPSPAIGTAAA